jgi:HAD superfamily hydrolase (TIGR01509 family)
MTFHGVIFDMDGTITEPYFDFGRIRAASKLPEGIDLLDYMRTATGKEYERIHRLLLRFEADGVANAKLNRGARTLLRALAQRRMPTALLTRNSRRSVAAVCEKLKLKFDVVITREDGPHKPAPEPIWGIAKQWGVKPGELLMVGDYKWDVLCAQNAGTPCALLLNGGETLEWAKGADYLIHRLREVLDIVEGRRK